MTHIHGPSPVLLTPGPQPDPQYLILRNLAERIDELENALAGLLALHNTTFSGGDQSDPVTVAKIILDRRIQ
jgi:hypothetical protein